MSNLHQRWLLFLFVLLSLSCTKVPVDFEDDPTENDPSISYFEDYKVAIATYKTDSFITSGHNVFMIGTHADPFIAKISADSYAEIEIPTDNPVKNKTVLFDSMVVVLTPNGNYYGDTLLPVQLQVHQLAERIENEDDSDNNFYYPRTFSRNTIPLATLTTPIRPSRKKEITIRLPDNLGREWLQKFRTDADEIQTQSNFRDYFKGICISSDSFFNNTLYYFTAGAANKLVRLYYRELSTTATERVLEFGYTTAKQFNHISFNTNNTPFSVFSGYKKQLKNSNITGGRALVSNNMPSYMKISFPDLLTIKERYPYIRIMQAQLEIKPAPQSAAYPYKIPRQLRMYISNQDNEFNELLVNAAGEAQNGNLVIDELYGRDTRYTFDITDFLSRLLAEGKFSEKALFLEAGLGNYDNNSDRLVINEQFSTDGIKLKLYVLGL